MHYHLATEELGKLGTYQLHREAEAAADRFDWKGRGYTKKQMAGGIRVQVCDCQDGRAILRALARI